MINNHGGIMNYPKELVQICSTITNTLDTFLNTFDLKHEEKFIG